MSQNDDDLTSLVNLDEPSILTCLSSRFERDKIYTKMSSILIAVNPYKELSIYGGDRDSSSGDPHIYSIAKQALWHVSKEGGHQSILCCGESGSGKTVSTRHLLDYLVTRRGGRGGGGNLALKIIGSNPILEAFGNAQTLRNNNSSRFAKCIQLFVVEGESIEKATIQTYLLEKSRVVATSQGEKNFHIFYHLVSSLKSPP